MDTGDCTHQDALGHLSAANFPMALRIAGPLLEANPDDLTAWRIVALALHRLGEEETARKSLKYIALAAAEGQRPIQALATVKELEALGGQVDDVLGQIAGLYSARSDRLEEAEMAPPPLPAARGVALWQGADHSLVGRAKEATAVAWGNALTLNDQGKRLPFVPLFSALDPEDFVSFARALTWVAYEPADVIIEQNTLGDAMYVLVLGEVMVVHQRVGEEPVELARLGPGAFFGEMALVSNAARAAEVRAIQPSLVLRADKARMEELAARLPEVGNVLVAFCHARMLENLMRVSPVLAPLPPGRRPDVIARFSSDYREAGQEIIEEGQQGPGLFLIVSGRVQVRKKEGGDEVVIATLGPGDLFGEISLLLRKPSMASVVAIENTALLFLSSEDFGEATEEFPELLKGAYDIASKREELNRSILARTTVVDDDLILV